MATPETDSRKYKYRRPISMRWSDMDEIGHVNNAVFLTYTEEARVHYLEENCRWDWRKDGIIIAHASIDFIAPLYYKYPAYIYTRVSRIGSKSFDMQYLMTQEKEGKEIPVAFALTTIVTFDYEKGISRLVSEDEKQKFMTYERSLSGE